MYYLLYVLFFEKKIRSFLSNSVSDIYIREKKLEYYLVIIIKTEYGREPYGKRTWDVHFFFVIYLHKCFIDFLGEGNNQMFFHFFVGLIGKGKMKSVAWKEYFHFILYFMKTPEQLLGMGGFFRS